MGYVVTYCDDIGVRTYGYFDTLDDARAAVLKLIALGAYGIKARALSKINRAALASAA